MFSQAQTIQVTSTTKIDFTRYYKNTLIEFLAIFMGSIYEIFN